MAPRIHITSKTRSIQEPVVDNKDRYFNPFMDSSRNVVYDLSDWDQIGNWTSDLSNWNFV